MTKYTVKKQGYHRNVSCETCHGPAATHTENPVDIKPPAPRDREFCPTCHAYDPSRPTGLPADQPGDAQPAEALHHLPQAARPEAADGARRSAPPATPRSSAPRRVSPPRAARVHDVPRHARAAQGHAAHRPAHQARPRENSAGSATGRTPPSKDRPRSTSRRTARSISAGNATTRTCRRCTMNRRAVPAEARLVSSWPSACRSGCFTKRPRCARRSTDEKPAASHWYGMGDRHRQVHRLRPLRGGVQDREQRAAEPFFFRTWVERYVITRRRRGRPSTSIGTADQPGDRSGGRTGHPAQLLRARSSATTARTRPACRCARSARPSRPRTASCWWTRSAASAAATASRPARTARATCIRSDEDRRQVHVLLPPHHEGAAAGVRRGLSDPGADLRRCEQRQPAR